MPRVNGSRPGSPSAATGSKPARCSGPYRTSIGMPDSVDRGSPSGSPGPPRVCRRWSSPMTDPSRDDPSLPRGCATVTNGAWRRWRPWPLTPACSGPRAVAGQERPQLVLGGRPLLGAGLEQDRVAMCTHAPGDVVAAAGPAVRHEGELPLGRWQALEGGRAQPHPAVVVVRVPGHERTLQAPLGGQRLQAVGGRLDAEEAAAPARLDEVGEGAPVHRTPSRRVREPVGPARVLEGPP